jgi:DNA-binding CsgD family transcriptional regulator
MRIKSDGAAMAFRLRTSWTSTAVGATMGDMASVAALVGRVTELALLRDAAARAAAGSPSAVLVHGEPGVGKTRLVSEVAARQGEQGFQVLSGRCVRFAANVSSYLPFLQAFGPSLGMTDQATGGSVLHRVGAAVGELTATGPVALVVDDLQWADESSLDVLAFLVAGFAPGQRLLLMGTYRDTELGAGHPLHGWLADMRRMPGVTFVPLGRFDRRDTELLVNSLLDARGLAALAAQTFDRSRGNAYLIELLVRDVRPGADRLPAVLPTDLREALLAAWHRLGKPTRAVMQMLAVGGRPVDIGVLQQVAAALGVDADKVAAGVVEATDSGLAVVDRDGSVWFYHPLVAEVLVDTLLPTESARLHAEYVAVWLVADRPPARLRTAHLALHYEAAGELSAALVWSVRAADEAERVGGHSEQSHHLARACGLWPRAEEIARGEAGAYAGLLLRATRAAHRAGDLDTALELGERAYGETATTEDDPLLCCRVLNELNQLRTMHGMDWSLAPLREAVRLSTDHPTSPEHVRALAALATHELWHGLPEAPDHAAEALRAGRSSGSDEALAHALVAAADARWGQPDSPPLAEEAIALARRTSDALLISHAAISWASCLSVLGRGSEGRSLLLDVYAELVRAGAQHEAGKIADHAARQLLAFGDWRKCRDLLRDAMSVRMATFFARSIRLTAARLAVRCGQLSAARQHLHRAEELAAARGRIFDAEFVFAAVELLAAERSWRDVVALITRDIESAVQYDPAVADQLMASAAAATAELCERQPANRREAVSRLDELEATRVAAGPAMFDPVVRTDPIPPAVGALYSAHRSRTTGDYGGDIDAWESAVRACDAPGLRWEAAQARYWLAAALMTRRGDRSRAATVLREGLRVAVGLAAEPLRADIEELALQAHLPLAEPDEAPCQHEPVLDGLTRREREVLQYLIAGRTYHEIAEQLFISDKTVSVHVSNLLRKTGTNNRIELAAMARRHTTRGD